MTPDRRQFVASLAGVPLLFQTATAARQTASKAGFSDPVLEQIIADLRELKADVEADKGPRKQTLRAIETTIGIQAAHLNAHYDAHVRTALRRREARLGRPGFVQELLNLAHDRKQHDVVTYQTLEAALTRVNERGLSGSLRDVRQVIRNIRLNAPDGLQPAGLRAMQYNYCSDLAWQIQMMEAIVAITCGIALLEPGPLGEPACGAVTLALGLLYAQRAWWC